MFLRSVACRADGRPGRTYTVQLDARTDASLAAQISGALSASHRNVTLLRGWNGVLPLPLHWGEVLALSYVAAAYDRLPAAASSPPGSAARLPPLVTLGLPLSRYNLSSAVAGGFRLMGRDLGRVLERSSAVGDRRSNTRPCRKTQMRQPNRRDFGRVSRSA